jgi:hypothetical protein
MVRMASAAEYVIDFSMITNFERLRPLIDLCIDFGSLEQNRSLLNRSVILNHYESFWSASELRRERVPQNSYLSRSKIGRLMCNGCAGHC